MEYGELRHRFGSEMALIGGIDSTALAEDEAAVKRAIEETLPGLLEKGHYLPCLDDRPRSNIPFAPGTVDVIGFNFDSFERCSLVQLIQWF